MKKKFSRVRVYRTYHNFTEERDHGEHYVTITQWSNKEKRIPLNHN